MELRNREPLKIGMKFCGGCNPAYDRIAAANMIRDSLKAMADFVPYEDESADLVLVFMGCASACADVSGIEGAHIRQISTPGDAERFIKEIKKEL